MYFSQLPLIEGAHRVTAHQLPRCSVHILERLLSGDAIHSTSSVLGGLRRAPPHCADQPTPALYLPAYPGTVLVSLPRHSTLALTAARARRMCRRRMLRLAWTSAPAGRCWQQVVKTSVSSCGTTTQGSATALASGILPLCAQSRSRLMCSTSSQ